MPKRIPIIGEGSNTFTPQLMQIFIRSEALRGRTVALMDVDAHRLLVAVGVDGRQP